MTEEEKRDLWRQVVWDHTAMKINPLPPTGGMVPFRTYGPRIIPPMPRAPQTRAEELAFQEASWWKWVEISLGVRRGRG